MLEDVSENIGVDEPRLVISSYGPFNLFQVYLRQASYAFRLPHRGSFRFQENALALSF